MKETLYTLSNSVLTVTVSDIGAQIKSIRSADGVEYMWSGDKAVWGDTAPILFPICGALVNDTYTYAGKTYTLSKHGFVRTRPFVCEKSDATCLVLAVASTPETKEVYPFDFTFRVIFSLENATLHVSYAVDNRGEHTMYYSVGGHEAYACPEGLEAYDLIFEKDEPLVRTVLDGSYLEHTTEPVEACGNTLAMKYSHMDNDCLVFASLKSNRVTLKQRGGARAVQVDFADCPYFVVWTKKGAPYLCLEPWNGIPDRVDADGALEHKEGIVALEPGKRQTHSHDITILG